MGGFNSYENSRWMTGQTSAMDSFTRLSGYFSDEFRTTDAFLLNLDSSFGFSIILPAEIEFSADACLEWNAERESSPGWLVNLSIVKSFLR